MKHVEDAHTNHFQEEEGTSNPLCECVWGGGGASTSFSSFHPQPAPPFPSASPFLLSFPLPMPLLPSLPSLTSFQSCPLHLLSMLLIFPTHPSSFPLSSTAPPPPPSPPGSFPIPHSPFPFPHSPFPFPLYCFPHTPARFEER